MAETKRLAVFLDGTWNTINDNTNVWRLKSLCSQTPEQRVYYSAGVGTQAGEHLSGGAYGIGINDEVTAAYEWLVEHYETDARIFIFGFSRGAFTARSLAGFISKCGLLKAGSPVSIKQLYNRYRLGTARSVRELGHVPVQQMSREEEWIVEYSRPVAVYFQGVWDTVGELGIPLPFSTNVSRKDFAFLETDLRINDSFAYHALAIDEHRKPFAPTLWTKSTPKQGVTYAPRPFSQVEQRWFVGAHANVGGGYPDDLLAQIPLAWLMGKAQEHGLLFKDAVIIDGDESTCEVHDSLKEMAHGIYELFTLGSHLDRVIGADPVDVGNAVLTNINESIDGTVFDRCRKDAHYRPVNLVAWAKRRGVDLTKLQGAVNAKDLSSISETPSPPPASK